MAKQQSDFDKLHVMISRTDTSEIEYDIINEIMKLHKHLFPIVCSDLVRKEECLHSG